MGGGDDRRALAGAYETPPAAPRRLLAAGALLVMTTPTRHHRQSARLRAMVVALVGLVSLTTPISLILLARFLFAGSHARGHALLFAGLVLWLPTS